MIAAAQRRSDLQNHRAQTTRLPCHHLSALSTRFCDYYTEASRKLVADGDHISLIVQMHSRTDQLSSIERCSIAALFTAGTSAVSELQQYQSLTITLS
jgi:hypothetical protein